MKRILFIALMGIIAMGLASCGKDEVKTYFTVTHDLILRAKWQAEAVAEYWQVAWDLNGGAKNLEKIKKWRDWEKWYPAFSWCAKKGDGWYLPAINELKTLCDLLFGNAALNARLEAIPGGKPLALPQYWSSTEKSDRTAFVYVPQLKSVVARNKTYAQSSSVSTRAIRVF